MSFKHVAHSSFNTKIENKSKPAYLQQKEPNKPEQTGIKTAVSVPLRECGCLKHNKKVLPVLTQDSGNLS